MTIKFKVASKPQPIRIKLKAQKTLDNNIIIYDHNDFDIVLQPEKMKILAFPKEEYSDDVYNSQSRLFSFLSKKGVVDRASIRGSNVHGSLECTILKPNEDINPIEAILFLISRFLKFEGPMFNKINDYEENITDWYTSPDEDESTELGKIPHSEKKGTMSSGMPYFRTFYGYYFE